LEGGEAKNEVVIVQVNISLGHVWVAEMEPSNVRVRRGY